MLHATGLGGPNGRAGAAGLGAIFRSLNNIIIAKRVKTPENASGVYEFTHGGHFWDFPVHRKKSSSHRKIFNGCVEYIGFLQGWRVPVRQSIFVPKRGPIANFAKTFVHGMGDLALSISVAIWLEFGLDLSHGHELSSGQRRNSMKKMGLARALDRVGGDSSRFQRDMNAKMVFSQRFLSH